MKMPREGFDKERLVLSMSMCKKGLKEEAMLTRRTDRVQVRRKTQTIAVMNTHATVTKEWKRKETMGVLGTHKQILCT